MIKFALASSHTDVARSLVVELNKVILFPLMSLMLAAAVLIFVWGGFQYLYRAEDASARQEGQRHMLYGVIGMVVMLAAYTILSIVVRTFFGDAAVPAVGR